MSDLEWDGFVTYFAKSDATVGRHFEIDTLQNLDAARYCALKVVGCFGDALLSLEENSQYHRWYPRMI